MSWRTAGSSASIAIPGSTPATTQRAPKTHMAAREKASASTARATAFERAAAEKGDAEGADEAGRGERRRERQQRAGGRHHQPQPPLRQLRARQDAWKISHSEAKPLSGGSAEIADAAEQEGERGERHAVDQAAEALHVALAGRGQHRAGAEEQHALEQRVVEDVEQRRR